jgi:hypothetical protein
MLALIINPISQVSQAMRRQQKRNFIALPVSAIGIDANGNSFRHPVCTLDISPEGARINGLKQVKTGDELTLEYKKNKVRFVVVWVGSAGTPIQGQAGLRRIDTDKKLADLDDFFAGDYIDQWSPGPPQ